MDIKRINGVSFETMEDNLLDDRFAKVKIWIAHTGQNHNKSAIDRETLIKLSASLKYTPIVGYVEKDKNNEEDFTGHKQVIVIEEDEVKVEYLTQAYGFISEHPNEKLEFRDGKEWLTCEGYLWVRFSGYEIMKNFDGERSQSMEISDVKGNVDKKGIFHITDGTFSGLCVLGSNTQPAMEGSTIELYSKRVDLKEQIEQMFHEFSMKGEQVDLDKEKMNETENFEDEVNEETAVEETEEETEETTEEETVEETNDESETEETVEAEETTSEDVVEENTSNFSMLSNQYEEFSLSHQGIAKEIYGKLKTILDEESDWAYILETFDDYVIYRVEKYSEEQGFTAQTFKCSYEADGDGVAMDLSSSVEVFAVFLTAEEQEKVENDREYVKHLEEELANLSSYAKQKEDSEKEAILEEFTELSSETVSELKEKMSNFSIEDFEKEVALAYVKQTKSTKNNKAVNVTAASFSLFKTDDADGEDTGMFGPLDRLFEK